MVLLGKISINGWTRETSWRINSWGKWTRFGRKTIKHNWLKIVHRFRTIWKMLLDRLKMLVIKLMKSLLILKTWMMIGICINRKFKMQLFIKLMNQVSQNNLPMSFKFLTLRICIMMGGQEPFVGHAKKVIIVKNISYRDRMTCMSMKSLTLEIKILQY